MKQFILLALIQLFTLTSLGQKTEIDDRGFLVKIGDTPQNIVFQLDDGTSVSLDDLKGKVVLLQFTASWCSVCRKEMPHIESEIWQKHQDKDLMVIGVDYDEPLEKLKEFKEQTGVTYPLALDPNADIFSMFAGKKTGVTRNVVLDKEGKIIFLTRLFDLNEFNKMIDVIEEELK